MTSPDLHTIRVDVPDRPCDVTIGPGAVDAVTAAVAATGAARVAYLTHDHLAATYPQVRAAIVAAGVDVVDIRMGDGESAKTWATVGAIVEELGIAGLRRDDLLVAFGGGVVTDTGGFSAATYLRGIRWLSVASTVLGALDAGVGGKTGVNLSSGKNLAGAFWQPSGVIVDTTLFATLPERQIRSGLAEAVKCGFIADPVILDRVGDWTATDTADLPTRDPDGLAEVVERGIAVKAAVVAADEREGGRRALLNYGHTLGHALEAACDFRLPHGEYVAIGMVAAAELAHRLDRISAVDVALHRDVLGRLGLPIDAAATDLAAAVPYLARDKKATRAGLRWVLLDRVGAASVVGGIEQSKVDAAIAAVTADA